MAAPAFPTCKNFFTLLINPQRQHGALALSILIAFFITWPLSLGAQQFERTYTYGSIPSGSSGICKRANGNILVLQNLYFNNINDVSVLMELTPAGDTLWTKEYRDNNGASYYLVQERPDRKIVMAGNSGSGSSKDGTLTLVDSVGNMLLTKRYYGGWGGSVEYIQCLTVGSDNSTYIAGNWADIYSGGVVFHQWRTPMLVKLNATLDIQWARTIGTNNTATRTSGSIGAMEITSDGQIAICGSTGSGSNSGYYIGPGKWRWSKFSTAGNQTWAKEKAWEGSSIDARAIISIPGGGFFSVRGVSGLIGGYDIVVDKFTVLGDTVWSKAFGIVNDDNAYSAAYDPSGFLVLAGYTRIAGDLQGMLLKIDQGSGAVVAKKQYGTAGVDNFLNRMIITNTGDYVFTSSTSTNALVIKTDANISSSCFFDIPSITVQPRFFKLISPSSDYIGEWNNFSSTPQAYSAAPTISTSCYTAPTCNVNAGFSPSSISVCQSTSISLTNTTSGATSYNWLDNNVSFSSAASPSLALNTPGSHIVRLIASNAFCADTSDIVVNVNALPSANAGNDVTICAGATTTLTATGGASYSWSNGLGNGQSHSVTPNISTSYTVTATDVNGCTATDVVTVTLTTIPTPSISASGPTTFCSGASVILNSSATSGNTWSNSATTSGITVNSSGTFTVTQTAGGCISAPSAPVTITVNPTPSAPSISASGPTTFCSGGSVTLNSSASSGNTWSNSATTAGITVNTGGSFTVTQTAGSCTSAPSAPVTVTVNPTPSAPNISATGPTTFCSGGSVTLNSSASSGNTWSNSATTNGITVTTGGTFTVTQTSGTCTSAPSAPVTVTVNPTPSAPSISASGPTTFCSGGSVTLSSSASTGNTWNNSATTPGITVNTGGTFTVSQTTGACTSPPSSPVTVTVVPNPSTPSISANGPTTFCAGGSVVLSSSAGTGNAWSNGGTSASITVSVSGTYSVTSTANGCTSAASAPISIIVNPIPAAPVISANGATTFCVGGNVVLSSSGGSATTWAPSGSIASTLVVNTTGTYTATATQNGCSSPTSNTISVIVNPLPVAQFNNVASGQAVTFTSTSLNNPTTYLWDFGDGASSTLQNPSHTYVQIGSYNVCLTVTNACGSHQTCASVIACSSPVSSFTFLQTFLDVNFTEMTAGVAHTWNWDFGDGTTSSLQNPVHSYTAPGTYQVCLTAINSCGSDVQCGSVTVSCYTPSAIFSYSGNGNTVGFSYQGGVHPGTVYQWTFGDGSSSGTQNPVHSYANPGIYNVCLTITTACGPATSCLSVSVNCVAPVANFSEANSQGAVNFTDISTHSPTQWLWDFGDGQSSTLQNPSHTYAVLQQYNVCLTASSVCGSHTFCKVVNAPTAMNDASEFSGLTIFPNPASEQFTVECGLLRPRAVSISLLDVLGKVVVVDEVVPQGFALKHVVDVTALPAGVYMLRLRQGDADSFRKVVLQ